MKPYRFDPLLLTILCLFLSVNTITAQNRGTLRFGADGQFKILQLTDLHWNENKAEDNLKNVELIESLAREEKPDLILFTGDVVGDPPILQGWNSIGELMEKIAIPWVVVLGNHDAEKKNHLTPSEIQAYIDKLPYYLSSSYLESYRSTNFVIPIWGHRSNRISHRLYCIDSHDYAEDQDLSHYAWIDWDQIGWYREVSRRVKKENSHALAFFHIPLPEFKEVSREDYTFHGHFHEEPSTPSLNSGLFCQMLTEGNVRGIFCGHDHDNDFISIRQGVALAYGRVSGYSAYGRLPRGGRVIRLYEGQGHFDTWIREKERGVTSEYYYPSGLSKEEEEALPYLPSSSPDLRAQLVPGLRYTYYEGRYKSVTQISPSDRIHSGVIDSFSLDVAQRPDSFAVVFEGYIELPRRGVYDFFVKSDDGSRLFIDDHLVVDNDGSHSARMRRGRVALDSGLHTIKVLYFESYMGEELSVWYGDRFTPRRKVPTEMLLRRKE